MSIHPSWFAAFHPDAPRRGPNSICPIHDQYCVTFWTQEATDSLPAHRIGRILHTSVKVYKIEGSWFWYRLPDFLALLRRAKDRSYGFLADRLEAAEAEES